MEASSRWMTYTNLPAIVVAAMLVLSPIASVPVAADEVSVAVETQYANEITDDSATLHGKLTALDNASNATVWFEYWEEGDSENVTSTPDSNSSEVGPFHAYPDDLESNTTYVFVAHASTENASAVGSEDTFTTEPSMHVEVETGSASAVTNDSASLVGELTVLRSDEDAAVWFEYWAADDPEDSSTTATQELDEPAAFSAAANELDSETDYVFVAHAESDNLSATGDEAEFATGADDHVAVSTEEPADVTADSATLHGNLTELRGAESAAVWFEYWRQGDAANASDTTEVELDGPGAFSVSIDDLEAETTYFVMAHAATENESAAGTTVELTTKTEALPLGIETDEASNIENRSATLNGELTSLGGNDTATVYFEYWVEDDRAGSSTVGEVTLDEPAEFEADVEDLETDTTYVYVAHARTTEGDVSGDAVEFTTGEPASAAPSWDGEGPFGQWLTSWLKNLVPQDSDMPFGQKVAELVRNNNPGADKRSDGANPGGNGNGPPDHAGPKDAADGDDLEGQDDDEVDDEGESS